MKKLVPISCNIIQKLMRHQHSTERIKASRNVNRSKFTDERLSMKSDQGSNYIT